MAIIRDRDILQPVFLTSTFGLWASNTNTAIEVLNSADSLNTPETLMYRDINGDFAGRTGDILRLTVGSVTSDIDPETTGLTLGDDNARWAKVFIGNDADAELNFDPESRFAVPVIASPVTNQEAQGSIIFNSDNNRFEGYNGATFASLGATIDQDDDTTITAAANNTAAGDTDTLSFFAGSAEDPLLEINDSGIIIQKVIGFSSNTQLRIPSGNTAGRRDSNELVSRFAGTSTLAAENSDREYILNTTDDRWDQDISSRGAVSVGDTLEIPIGSNFAYFRVIDIPIPGDASDGLNLVLKFTEERQGIGYGVLSTFPDEVGVVGQSTANIFRIKNFIGDIRYNADPVSQRIEYVSSLNSDRTENWSTIGGIDVQRLSNTTPNTTDQTFEFFDFNGRINNGENNPGSLQEIGESGLDVYLNGIKQLGGSDFTISGNTVTSLGNTLNFGDDMEVVVFDTFSVSNHYTKAEWTNGIVGSASITGDLSVGGNVTVGGTQVHTSLRKLKNNIVDINNPLDKVMKLRGVEFDWKKNGNHEIGFIKEEVELVEKTFTTDEGVKYSNITALLVEAIKEQQKQITELKEELQRK